MYKKYVNALRTLQFTNEDIITFVEFIFEKTITEKEIKEIVLWSDPIKNSKAREILGFKEIEAYMVRNLRVHGNCYIGENKNGKLIIEELKAFNILTTLNSKGDILYKV